jgi:hypothetical protein
MHAPSAQIEAKVVVNQLLVGHAASVMAAWPMNWIDLIACSPPERIEKAAMDGGPLLLVGFPKYATRDELEALLATELGTAGREKGEAKHKRRTYGRKVPMKRTAG